MTTTCTEEHYDWSTYDCRDLLDFEYCEDCGAEMVFSCCNYELTPYPEDGGFCPDCKEHCL